jgi:hypothetical protein
LPAFSDIYKPPSLFSIKAYNLSVLDLATAIAVIPQTPLGKPLLVLIEKISIIKENNVSYIE